MQELYIAGSTLPQSQDDLYIIRIETNGVYREDISSGGRDLVAQLFYIGEPK